MLGISKIGSYIASDRYSNIQKAEKYCITEEFVTNKIGIEKVARKKSCEKTSELCCMAYEDLVSQMDESELSDVDFICVCTQNGDYRLPQTSAIMQSKIGISSDCAAFDISLGCSGYVYALHIAKSFMESSGLRKGLVFTGDPYSDIIDPNDKNTDLLFGDGAAVTLISNDSIFDIGEAVFETHGEMFDNLIKHKDQKLVMNGRGIFSFAMTYVPKVIDKCLKINKLDRNCIDVFLLHQASRYIFDNLCKRMNLEPKKVPFLIKDYGNTVSSSIPIILKEIISKTRTQNILLCGFGVGLSIAASILRRR